ncbi:hypothetical protein [Lutibacter sp.]|uniref:hypothetical protein n=1 Tax=Lutibacter sp. TaxID=1925666 RepID=UPI002734DB8E|nr:hypothetical protein [Lutibacter sp.]MDP3312430.1 hypothetical protein [Lutibacter sp.]
MKKKTLINNNPLKLRQYVILSILIWTILILFLLRWDKKRMDVEAINRAYIYTKVGFDKDILYRRWASDHGGVYVPILKKRHQIHIYHILKTVIFL